MRHIYTISTGILIMALLSSSRIHSADSTTKTSELAASIQQKKQERLLQRLLNRTQGQLQTLETDMRSMKLNHAEAIAQLEATVRQFQEENRQLRDQVHAEQISKTMLTQQATEQHEIINRLQQQVAHINQAYQCDLNDLHEETERNKQLQTTINQMRIDGRSFVERNASALKKYARETARKRKNWSEAQRQQFINERSNPKKLIKKLLGYDSSEEKETDVTQ